MIKLFHGASTKSKRRTFLFEDERHDLCSERHHVGRKNVAVKTRRNSGGAREAYTIEEPFAAAIGAGLPVWEPTVSMVVVITVAGRQKSH